jgi:protein SCO1/2
MNTQKFSIILLIILAILVTLVLLKPGLFNKANTNQGETLSSSIDPKKSEELKRLGFYQFKAPRPLSDTPLKDLEGADKKIGSLVDGWQLVNFGYMFCPDICPINLRLMSELKKELSEEEGINFAITHITFDPERDTPDRLRPYLDYINPDYIGLTGDLDNIRKVAQQLNTVFIHEKPDEYGNYFITHSDSIPIIDPQGQYVGLFKGPYDKDNLKQALKLLIK